MSQILEDTDVVLDEKTDEPIPCRWKFPVECGNEGTWELLWSCGHVWHYCDEHVGEALSLANVVCVPHANVKITVVAAFPTR